MTHPHPLRGARQARGLTQAKLAAAAGISRQSLNAIEAGRAEPSVKVALRLGSALGQSVERLFGATPAPDELPDAELAGPKGAQEERRLALGWVRGRWVAHPLPGARPELALQAADGLGAGRGRAGRTTVELLRPLEAAKQNVLLVGCAPLLGVLASRLNASSGPGRFIWLPGSSAQALAAVEEGCAHVGGVHGKGAAPGADLVALGLVRWEAGLVVRRGAQVEGVGDLCRPGLRLVAREKGAGARALLERSLRAEGISPGPLLARALVGAGHLEVAGAVAMGAADAGVTIRSAALAHRLRFLPLAEERFDLLLARPLLDDPRILRLLEALHSGAVRRELEALGGYDLSPCGQGLQAPR